MKGWRRYVIAVHRDMGFLVTGIVLVYAVSGLAVNHVGDWDPDFVIERRPVTLELPSDPGGLTAKNVTAALAGIEDRGELRTFDSPSPRKVKIYLDDGSILVSLEDGSGTYETIRRRPVLYGINRLHLDPAGWWLVLSDVFALALVFLAGTGMVMRKGRAGLAGRGKWWLACGVALPLLAMSGVG